MAQGSGFLTQDVSPLGGYAFGGFVAGAGFAALTPFIAAGVGLSAVPDSFFGAATYLGLTGVAVAVRTHSHTAQNASRWNFLARTGLGLLIVLAAGVLEIGCKKPDVASLVVYVAAVVTELAFFLNDARKPAPTPPPTPTPTPPPPPPPPPPPKLAAWSCAVIAFLIPVLIAAGIGFSMA